MLNSFAAVKHTLFDEDKPGRIEIELSGEPGATALQDVQRVLLQFMCALFLNVQPRSPSQAFRALRLIPADRSTDSRSTISSSVMSLLPRFMRIVA